MISEIKNLFPDDKAKFHPPATAEEIKQVGDTLNVCLPDELVDLLSDSNGVEQLMENPITNELMSIGDIYWPTHAIISCTLSQYKYLETIESKHKTKYLFFADSGCGENFGYKIIDGKCYDTTIYVYYPIEDKYVPLCANLKEWLIGWLSGKLFT
jgi:hypothetical protein